MANQVHSISSAATTITASFGGGYVNGGKLLEINAVLDVVGEQLLIEDIDEGSSVKASGDITLSGTAAQYDFDADYVTVDGVRFYPKISTHHTFGPQDFAVTNGAAATSAAALITLINRFCKRVVATAGGGGVVTLTAAHGGAEYNDGQSLSIDLATTNGTAMAITAMSSGTDAWKEIGRCPGVSFISGQINDEVAASLPIDGLPFHRLVRVSATSGNILAGANIVTNHDGLLAQKPALAIV